MGDEITETEVLDQNFISGMEILASRKILKMKVKVNFQQYWQCGGFLDIFQYLDELGRIFNI